MNSSLAQHTTLRTVSLSAAIVLILAGHLRAQQFRPGDEVLASPTMMSDAKYYKRCTVIRPEGNSYRLMCEGTEYSVPRDYVRQGKAANTQPPPPVMPNTPPVTVGNAAGKFKVGDRVMVTITGLKADKYWEPCTIIRGFKNGSYGVKCDRKSDKPIKEEVTVLPDWIKAWPNAGPAPSDPECSFEPTPGNVTRASAPSAAVFKRLIYLVKGKEAGGRKFGVTFETFQIGATTRNVAWGRNGGLRYPTAPINAVIHNVETRLVYCVRYDDSVQRFVIQAKFGCFKTSNGEWTCGTDSARTLQHDYIENK